MLSFIFYCAFMTFIVYRSYAEALQLRNRYAMSYMTLSVEFVLISESCLGELRLTSELALNDWFLFLIFFLYVIFFLCRVRLAFKASKIKNYTTNWWEAVHNYASYSIRKAYVISVRAYCKPLKKEYTQYWLRRHFDKKLNFRYKLYINVVSYTYIFMYIFAICGFIFLNVFMLYLDYYALLLWLRFYIGNHILHFIFCCFLYRLFLSYIFPNIKLRHFVRFHSVLTGYCCGIVDSYTILNSFMMHKMMIGKRYLVEQDFLYYSGGLLGMKKYIRRFFGRKGYKYWFTLENNKAIYKRYYFPVSWSHYKSIELDELVETPYHQFKMWLFKWKYLILTGSLKPYLLKQKSRVVDHECLELSRYYDHNLKMNYKKKD